MVVGQINICPLLATSTFQQRLSDEQVSDLSKVVDLRELKRVVWDTNAYKAPGPDGLQAI